MTARVRPLEELADAGVLWLINAAVFHPRGVAIGLQFDDEGKVSGWTIQGSPDESPFTFADHDLTAQRKRAIEQLIAFTIADAKVPREPTVS